VNPKPPFSPILDSTVRHLRLGRCVARCVRVFVVCVYLLCACICCVCVLCACAHACVRILVTCGGEDSLPSRRGGDGRDHAGVCV